MMIGLGETYSTSPVEQRQKSVHIDLPEGGYEGKPFKIYIVSVKPFAPVKADFYAGGRYFGTKNYGYTDDKGYLTIEDVFGGRDAANGPWTTKWFIGNDSVTPWVTSSGSSIASGIITVIPKLGSGAPDQFLFAPKPARSAIDEWVFGDSDPGFGAIYVYGLLGLGAVILFLMMRGGEKKQ
jgi:hypothetical protein